MHTRQRSVVQFYSAPTVQFLSALDICEVTVKFDHRRNSFDVDC